MASFDSFKTVKDIAYGKAELNHLDIYIPEDKNNATAGDKSVIVFFYGGCWGGCYTGFKEDYLFVAQAITNQGLMAVLVDYRRYPEVKFAEIMDDARLATEWVRNNIAEYGGNPDQIFLMGHSAGAHMAALLALDESYLSSGTLSAIKGFIGLAGPYDFLPFTKPYQFKLFAPVQSYPKSQPINFVDGIEAPLLLLHGNKDETVKPRNVHNLAKKVKDLGGKVETYFYDDIDHINILGSLSIPMRNSQPVMTDIVRFINEHEKN